MPPRKLSDDGLAGKAEELYNKIFEEQIASLPGRNNEVKEREAQKFAIAESAKRLLQDHPLRLPEIWRALNQAHICRKVGLKISAAQVEKAISAENSWKKSSGHALEKIIVDLLNPSLLRIGISLYLQKDLTELIRAGRVTNPQREIPWIKERIQASNFDIYMGFPDQSTKGGVKIFGLVQSKASIRDRVKGDREFSIDGMKHFFWSVAFCLDGAFLLLPKFDQMVNGGSPSFSEPGWHGMYVFIQQEPSGRIFILDPSYEPFLKHAKKAKSDWIQQRQWLDPAWQP